jgi:hypothetical protein
MITQTILLPRNSSPRKSKADCSTTPETTPAKKNPAASFPKDGRESMGIEFYQKIRKVQGMLWELIPWNYERTPNPQKTKKPRKIRGLLWELRDSNPRPSACKEKKTSFQIFITQSID